MCCRLFCPYLLHLLLHNAPLDWHAAASPTRGAEGICWRSQDLCHLSLHDGRDTSAGVTNYSSCTACALSLL